MKEKELNTCIKNSLCWAYKIPDPPKITLLNNTLTTKRPFDGFGIGKIDDKYHIIFWESKFLRKLESFSFKKIKIHQFENLDLIDSFKIFNVKCFIIVGCYVKRGDIRIFIFDWSYIKEKIVNENKKSLLKKELENLPFNPLKKGIFEFKNIIYL